MTGAALNHVSVVAGDLDRSIRFYEAVFGLERLPTPNFGFPVQWLGIGDTQLHLFNRDMEAPSHHHFAVTVDEVEPVYTRAAELGAFDHDAFGHHLFELPGDTVQLYLRDPGGNLVEVDSPGVGRLPDAIRAELKRLADVHPQDQENESARLYVGGASAAV
jgi:catechol 2,3-dioxygenase-like lactoylglutathione lyase family enzyme